MAEQWSKILWPASQAKKKLARSWVMITAWEEPKKSPQKLIKPKDQKPRSGVDQKPFDLTSFIRTGKSMKEEQKRNFIWQSMTDDSIGWMSPTAWARLLNVKSVFTSKYKSLRIPTLLQSLHARAERQVLVDSGSTDNFISHKLLKRMKIGTLELKHPCVIWNVDGTHNRSRMIKKFADLQVRCGDKVEQMKFLVTDLGDDEIILGYPWLAAFQPKLDWKNAVLDESMQPLVIKTLGLNLDEEVVQIRTAWCKRAASLATPGEEIFLHRFEESKVQKTSTAAELAVKALPKEEKTWDQIVPPQYHKWKKVFSEEEAKQFPQHQPWDITVDLVEGAPKTLDCKIYPLTLVEQGKLDEYIKENLEKGYIRPSHLQYSSPFFFVGKKDGKSRPVIDYRKLNSFTVPD
jgi:hypothetical protein